MVTISFFVYDLSKNPIVRAYPLAKACQKLGYQVEVLGLQSQAEIYAPYRDAFEYKTFPSRRWVWNTRKLASMATGDIIYGCKPLWDSFGAALFASGFGQKKPLLLDVEDDELIPRFDNVRSMVRGLALTGWTSRVSIQWRLILHLLTRLSAYTTVSSRKLQRRYGGEILLHGPDETLFDPRRPELSSVSCRERFGLPQDVPIVLFAGTPRTHKGIDMIIEALRSAVNGEYHLALAGPADHPDFRYGVEVLGKRCHLLGHVPYDQMPRLLSAVDIVPTPQRRDRFTESQIPAKLIEAMAMEKTVIASRVSDLGEILGENTAQPRGWVIPPEDTQALAMVFTQILTNRDEVKRRTQAARQFFLENASIEANAQKLARIIKNVMA